MKITTVANQKGGVGKTTLEIHLAACAAEDGKRVLVVDLDEGDLSQFFPQTEDGDNTPYLMSSQLFNGEHEGRQPRQVGPNIWLIEADVALLDVDDMDLDVIHALRPALERFSDDFDLCMIDTPPNLQRRMVAALTASHAVVAPFNISAFTLARLPKLMNTIETVQDRYNPNLRFLGYLPNLVNSRSPEEIDALPGLRESYGDAMFAEQIIYRPCINKSLAAGNPVWWKARSGSQREAGREMKRACKAVLDKVWAE
ncbi:MULTISPECIES: ParA family protein [Pseudomonas chlororaphis group]|uniref:Partition protein A n=1 Tax=Pseudomonas lundensis TaxID=86185 RepID=A0AAX2HEK1_9PSED|nr:MULTISPECIES: ParA family protein [Pseudomonas chlororaphis group]PAA00731.1 partition protein A [Pseudomonas fragi]SOB54828.1 Partition protein A [Pseudomonas lundensis]